LKIGELKLREQFLIEVDKLSTNVALYSSEGILGLAHHSKKRMDEGRTLMARLFKQNSKMPHMFSMLLNEIGNASRIVFGDPDVKRYAKEEFIYGKSYYMSVSTSWVTSVYSIGFDKTGVVKRFNNAHGAGAPAMVDSGTSFIVLAPAIWDSLMIELQRHMRDCSIPHTDGGVMMCTCPVIFDHIPTLVLNLIDDNEQEHSLCMAASEYVSKTVDPRSGKFSCVPSIQRGNDQQPVPLILGMTLMRSFYTNFDVGQHRIGFARSAFSAIPAGATCSVENRIDAVTWMITTVVFAGALVLAFYICCCGDINACCGYPSCKVSSPCYLVKKNSYSYVKDDRKQGINEELVAEADGYDAATEPIAGCSPAVPTPCNDAMQSDHDEVADIKLEESTTEGPSARSSESQ
jgi:hypothetical protein